MKKVLIGLLVVAFIGSVAFNVYMVNYISQQTMGGRRPAPLVYQDANSRETYFTMHNVARAHKLSRGAGVKVGILDTYFGYESYPDLYAGGKDFADKGASYLRVAEHGYWMANTLKEIAPEVEVYALGVDFDNEEKKVDTIIKAIDWAITNGIDILTYSSAKFSPESRKRLDPAVDKAHANNIVTTFIHYEHPNNLFPAALTGNPRAYDSYSRAPDLNILQYDYNVVMYSLEEPWRAASDEERQSLLPPFLSWSSTSPVTAGLVALLMSINGDLTVQEYRELLMNTSREITYENNPLPRVPDAFAAVSSLLKAN